jgi:hypothetical protein
MWRQYVGGGIEMASELFQRLAEDVKQLSPEEQAELRKLLEKLLLDELDRRLLARGVISRIPPPPTEADIERWESWKPIKIEGKPLSETIIEDRR